MGVTESHHHFVGEKMFNVEAKLKKAFLPDSLPSTCIRKKTSTKLVLKSGY